MRWELQQWRRGEPDLRERKRVKEGTPKGGAEKFRAWGIEQTATFHHQNSSYSEKKKEKKKPWTVSICFGGWKAGGEIKQAFDISAMYKGNHTLGRIRWWTSSSYIHCLSYQCIHTPPWNQSQNTLCKILFPIVYGYKALVLWLYWVCQKNYSILFLSDKTSLAVITPPKAATKWFNTMPQKLPRCPSSLFCLCVGSLARLMFRVGKRNQESICWWRGMAVQLM